MDTLKELYKIGCGPSSSHTMGPQRASEKFLKRNKNAKEFKVTLYGSLAATGKGHLTDYIIEKTFYPRKINVIFREDIVKKFHPNGMLFEALDENEKVIDTYMVYSIGGGSLKEEDEKIKKIDDYYNLKSMNDIIEWCKNNNKNYINYILENEDSEIMNYIQIIKKTMENSIQEGLEREDTIPGKLNLKRRAKKFYEKYKESKQLSTLIYSYALAVSEQNASGYDIVTAPTCGSAGVVPGVLIAFKDFYKIQDNKIEEALLVGGLVGNLIKNNASISGAEVGCQGEIGAACSMAAAAIAYLKGGNLSQIEYAAEIGLEHHLGMTCDPVYGYVQIPCIERNAMGAQRALDAANYALLTDGSHYISFDQCVLTMKETGIDLHDNYKETAKGGLAKHFFTC